MLITVATPTGLQASRRSYYKTVISHHQSKTRNFVVHVYKSFKVYILKKNIILLYAQ